MKVFVSVSPTTRLAQYGYRANDATDELWLVSVWTTGKIHRQRIFKTKEEATEYADALVGVKSV